MLGPDSPRGPRARAAALLLLGVATLGAAFGCGDGGGRGDRAMIDPAKADAERKSAEDAIQKSYKNSAKANAQKGKR